jgi:hypothetical protein
MGVISNGTTLLDAGVIDSGIPTGAMTLIKTITLSSAAGTVSFVDGTSSVVLDDTYDSYVFKFFDIHPSTDISQFSFNMSVDTGSNYNVAKTTTAYRAYHSEDDAEKALAYFAGMDLAQGTGFQPITYYSGIQNDSSNTGTLTLYNPSSTTFVKHFICTTNEMSRQGVGSNPPLIQNYFTSGYGNTTSAVDAIQFKFHQGNVDTGTIKMYGIK